MYYSTRQGSNLLMADFQTSKHFSLGSIKYILLAEDTERIYKDAETCQL